MARRNVINLTAVCIVALAASAGLASEPDDGGQLAPFARGPVACFAPGTPQATVQATLARSMWTQMMHSLSAPGILKYEFSDGARWTSTATDGSGLSQGDPMTLTWSIVPDGTSIYGYIGEPTANSDLRAFLNGIYGSEALWLAVFQQVFDRWSELTGITYVYEASDDGAAFPSGWPSSPGSLGVRGDVRIAGHFLDGDYGVLGYNFFPNSGDMVIDTGDSFYSNTSGNSLGFRNVLAHEHGHGIGLSHVCPMNQTKLMEPYLSYAFDGPQHDDILAANRGYGDRYEHDDTVGTAASLGPISGATTEQDLSVDDSSDTDVLSFTVSADNALDVTVTPIGASYLSGPQNPDGSCTAGTSFDSLRIHDLSVRVLDSNGTSELASADLGGVGVAEVLTDVALTSGAGTYYVEITGDSTDSAQLYEVGLTLTSSAALFSDGFEAGGVGGWSGQVP